MATNQTEEQKLPTSALLENYKTQAVSVEWVFRFLKDQMFFAHSLFLKNTARIMEMIMIMGLALLIFALGERQLRLALKQNNETIPDQKRKPTQTPTLRWVFQTFEGLDILSDWSDCLLINHQILNLRPVHHQIIRLLCPHVQKYYFSDP